MTEELNPCSCGGAATVKREEIHGNHGRDPEERVHVVCQRCGSNVSQADWPGRIKQADVDALKARWNRLHQARNSGESPAA